LQVNDDSISSEAWEVWNNAYVPYSGFKVGAVLVADSGKRYTGCNIEVPIMSLSLCAERVALINALTHGERNFVSMVIAAGSDQPLMPCGACRQMLSEFASNLLITSLNRKGGQITVSLKELFPYPPVHGMEG